MGGIHSLYCSVLYSRPSSRLDAYDVAPNILAALLLLDSTQLHTLQARNIAPAFTILSLLFRVNLVIYL